MLTAITRIVPALLLVLATLTRTATAQPGARTAGDVALLANSIDDTTVPVVTAALEAEDAMVRATAARIAAVTAYQPFGPVVERAWGKERHPLAATEQVRALLIINGPTAASAIEARLDALPAAALDALVDWLAVNQPARVAGTLTKLGARANAPGFDLNLHVWSALKALASQTDASDRLLRSWMAISSRNQWRATLERLSSDGGSASREAVIIDALKVPNNGIREATVWHVVSRVARGQPVTSTVIAAATAQVTPDQPPTWEAFGRELLARRHADTRTADRAALLAAQSSAHMSDARAIAQLPQLTNDERQALKTALGLSFPSPETEKMPAVTRDPNATMRTIPPLWPGLLESLLDAAKCQPERSTTFALASAAYRPDGRVAKLQLDSAPLPAGCARAVTALARMTIVNRAHAPAAGTSELLVLPIGRDFVECSNQMPVEPLQPERIGGTVTPPRKTKDVRPDYPPLLRKQGVTGRVVLEGIISPAGCINSVAVTGSVVPALDFAALKAVSGWQFTPTLVDGKPVPVIMTVTVSFALTR